MRPPARRSHYLHYVYFALAAFDVLTAGVGVYFSHALMTIYVDSVAVGQAWAGRVSAFSHLGELAAAANSPANDVFLTADVETEMRRMTTAAAAFHAQLRKARAEVETDLDPSEAEPLLEKLDAVAQAMKDMTGEARLTFVHFEKGQPIAASANMASMDRRYAELNRALAELRENVATTQQRHFERQLTAAAKQEKYLYLSGALLLLMVAGATLYGHRLAKQVRSDAAERERQSREVAVSNDRLQAETRQKMLALEVLQKANDKLQSLFNRTLERQEQKRRHIARELHEEVSQTLATLKLHLSTTRAPALRAAGDLAEDALHRLRDLAHDLTPHGMELVGLAPVLRTHLGEWTRGSAVRVRFADRVRVRPPFRIEQAAYRVAQEAVANTVRHAEARRVLVEVRGSANELQLRIVDDGRGFDVQAVRRQASLGLALMEQRAAMVGGTLEVRSAPGEGTSVLATFPLQRQIDWLDSAKP